MPLSDGGKQFSLRNAQASQATEPAGYAQYAIVRRKKIQYALCTHNASDSPRHPLEEEKNKIYKL